METTGNGRLPKAKDGQDGDAHPFKLQRRHWPLTSTETHFIVCCGARHRHRRGEINCCPRWKTVKLVLEALRPMFKTGATGKPGATAAPCIELKPLWWLALES